MKTLLKTFIPAIGLLFATEACIQDEALNTEADILTCSLPEEYLSAAPRIDNNTVTLNIQPDIDISALAPVFTLTEGATISPASGTAIDFLNAKDHAATYTVTSQDGQWSKDYTVRVVQQETPSTYYFNTLQLDKDNNKYTIFNEYDEFGNFLMAWASGNPGYVLCGVADVKAREAYPNDWKNHIWEFFPTTAVFENGVSLSTQDGVTWFVDNGQPAQPNFLRLITRSTGTFGNMVGMPIAAGNIFQGFFDISIAIADPRGATKFGEPYRYMPDSFKGKYRYKAGETFTDERGNAVPGKKDIFSIYALFYETDDKTEYLDGSIHDANFRHPNLVAIAMVDAPSAQYPGESDEWIEFDVKFDYVQGKTVDPSLLAKGAYKIGIVISSSADGDYFKGAVGSTLDIDDLAIINQNTDNQL